MRNRTSLAQRSEPSTWSRPTRSASCLSANSTAKMGPQTGCSSSVKPSNSPLRARRRASMRSGAQEVRLARVRVRTLSPSRKDSRKRMAGGELRLGTAVIYMSVCIPHIAQIIKKKLSIYMTTSESERQTNPFIYRGIRENGGGKICLEICKDSLVKILHCVHSPPLRAQHISCCLR